MKCKLPVRIIEKLNTQYRDQMIQTVMEYWGNAIERLNYVINLGSELALRKLDLFLFLSFLTAELNADVDFQPTLRKFYCKYHRFINNLIAHGVGQGLIKREFDPDPGALTFNGHP